MSQEQPPLVMTAFETGRIPPSAPSLLSGVNILLEGPTGTGKTWICGTLAEVKDLETFFLFTEAGIESLLAYFSDRGLDIPSNIHWHVLRRGTINFTTLAAVADTINRQTQDSLYKMQDPQRSQHKNSVLLILGGLTAAW